MGEFIRNSFILTLFLADELHTTSGGKSKIRCSYAGQFCDCCLIDNFVVGFQICLGGGQHSRKSPFLYVLSFVRCMWEKIVNKSFQKKLSTKVSKTPLALAFEFCMLSISSYIRSTSFEAFRLCDNFFVFPLLGLYHISFCQAEPYKLSWTKYGGLPSRPDWNCQDANLLLPLFPHAFTSSVTIINPAPPMNFVNEVK